MIPKRVLFIGNSYTGQIENRLLDMLSGSPYKDTSFHFITAGGITLKRHLNDENTLNSIKTGKWDIVVLQEQSQFPALPGKREQSFQTSVDVFTELIRRAGAEPLLYMTWGRLDGDKTYEKLFPDYDTMQQKLSDAYIEAAKRNKIPIAPVGEVWSIVREKDTELGRGLYANDGSHPSSKGAFLACCVFFRTLFNDSLESIQPHDGVTGDEAELIKSAVLSL